MIKVEIEKKCGCFTEERLESSYSHNTREDANKKADELIERMNTKFCGKHKFKKIEENSIIKIVEDEE